MLLRFEINVRGATVIGFVGAGGIGQELYSVISFNYYQEIGAIIVLIILTVSADRPDVGEAAHARDRTAWMTGCTHAPSGPRDRRRLCIRVHPCASAVMMLA